MLFNGTLNNISTIRRTIRDNYRVDKNVILKIAAYCRN